MILAVTCSAIESFLFHSTVAKQSDRYESNRGEKVKERDKRRLLMEFAYN